MSKQSSRGDQQQDRVISSKSRSVAGFVVGAMKWLLWVGGLCLLVYLCVLVLSFTQTISTYNQVKAEAQNSYVQVLDSQGRLLQTVRANFKERRYSWVGLDDISTHLIQAVLNSEDKRFFQHGGVDWLAIASAAKGKLFGRQRGGASTISMQLAAMLDPEIKTAGNRSLMQKFRQILAAMALDRQWSKKEILEAYLNRIAFRGENVGINSASRVFFGKYAIGLDNQESALLAAMIRAPNASPTLIRQRTCGILKKQNPSVDCKFLGVFVDYYLKLPNPQVADEVFNLPHFSYYLLNSPRLKVGQMNHLQQIHTDIDGDLQQFAIENIRRHLRELEQEKIQDAAVVVLDNNTGKVLAYVGSSAELGQAAQVDHARALRQAGSTLKPFLYALAIEERRLTAASLLNDSPISLSVGEGLYIPQNYDRNFAGWVSVRTALASSLNIPAVRTLTITGVDDFYSLLKQLGLPLDQRSDFYGYSLALGSADVNLLSLTNAYRALANLGQYSEVNIGNTARIAGADAIPTSTSNNAAAVNPQSELKQAVRHDSVTALAPQSTSESFPGTRQYISKQAAWIVGDILSDRQARVRTFGLSSVLNTPFWTAVKTGTSKDMRDNWTIGWSQHYTVGVWVGNSTGASMRDVSGVTGAGPIWHDVMLYLHRNRASEQPPQPSQVVATQVDFSDQIEPMRKEFFIDGSQLQHIQLAQNSDLREAESLRISSPVDGTIIALDPDIPSARQKMLIQAKGLVKQSATQVFWYIDQQLIGHGDSVAWFPQPGNHTLVLKDQKGQLLDSVKFQVRGAYKIK